MTQSSASSRIAVSTSGTYVRGRTRVICGLALWAAVCGAAGCASAAAIPSLFETQGRIQRYIDSGQYDKEFASVVARARAYMEKRSAVVSKAAIVLDIDETSLSNWPAYRVNGWARITTGPCDLEHGPCGIRAWQAMAAAKALVPTLELAKRADALGVAVFFITGRPPDLRDATERNLRQEGYRVAGLVLLPEGASFKSAVDFKAPERRKIAGQGYTIILTMGDQESDLVGGYAEKTFKLPNPVYFLP
jgi:acid phosphatase